MCYKRGWILLIIFITTINVCAQDLRESTVFIAKEFPKQYSIIKEYANKVWSNNQEMIVDEINAQCEAYLMLDSLIKKHSNNLSADNLFKKTLEDAIIESSMNGWSEHNKDMFNEEAYQEMHVDWEEAFVWVSYQLKHSEQRQDDNNDSVEKDKKALPRNNITADDHREMLAYFLEKDLNEKNAYLASQRLAREYLENSRNITFLPNPCEIMNQGNNTYVIYGLVYFENKYGENQKSYFTAKIQQITEDYWRKVYFRFSKNNFFCDD